MGRLFTPSQRRVLLRVVKATDGKRGCYWPARGTKAGENKELRKLQRVGLVSSFGLQSYTITEAGRAALAYDTDTTTPDEETEE